MIVAGGIYREECLAPKWSRIFGSGGRAAAAIAGLSPATELHAYVSEECHDDAMLSLQQFGVGAHLTPIRTDIEFKYFHPLSRPELTPSDIPSHAPIRATGQSVLRFGFVEGDAVVTAERAVFDPQHSLSANAFRENGSSTDELAIVLNEDELQATTGEGGRAAAEGLRQATNAAVVVTKKGPLGATVCTRDDFSIIPAHISPVVFKIGSGDVFSAAFAHMWAERRTSPVEAAVFASQAVARYVATRNVEIIPEFEAQTWKAASVELPAGPISQHASTRP